MARMSNRRGYNKGNRNRGRGSRWGAKGGTHKHDRTGPGVGVMFDEETWDNIPVYDHSHGIPSSGVVMTSFGGTSFTQGNHPADHSTGVFAEEHMHKTDFSGPPEYYHDHMINFMGGSQHTTSDHPDGSHAHRQTNPYPPGGGANHMHYMDPSGEDHFHKSGVHDHRGGALPPNPRSGGRFSGRSQSNPKGRFKK